MEKGDKPKPKESVAKPKDKKLKDKKPKDKKPKDKKSKVTSIKGDTTQSVLKSNAKQTIRQTVKVIIPEKGRRKYTTKPKAIMKPVFLGGEGDISQIQNIAQRQAQIQIPQVQQRSQPISIKQPLLSATQAPVTLDTDLTAVSELPIARSPVFEEEKKKVVVKKRKPVIVQIGEGIGDFIKQNLLDQPADFNTQEANNSMEMPRPPLTIRPESQPVQVKKTKPKKDIPITSKYAVEQARQAEMEQMGMEDVNRAESKKLQVIEQKESAPVEHQQEETKKVKNPRKKKELIIEEGEFEVVGKEPKKKLIIEEGEFEVVGKEPKKKLIIEEGEFEVVGKEPKYQGYEKEKEIEYLKAKEKEAKGQKLTNKEERAIYWGDYERRPRGSATEVSSLQDPAPLEGEKIQADTVSDITSTIQDPVFSNNPDFKVISQNVDVESPEFGLDYGNEDITQFNVDGFVPVGTVEGFSEKRGRGRPRIYPTAEEAAAAKKEQNKGYYKQGKERAQMAQEDFYGITYKQPIGEIEFPLKVGGGKAYDGDFQSGDFQQQAGDLIKSNNFTRVEEMEGNEFGYSDQNPVLTENLFSSNAVDSNLPFLGIEDIEFV